MWQINSKFEDDFQPLGKSSFYLKTNSNLSPYNIEYPISWTGFINNIEIEIIQISQSAFEVNDFEFITFPEKYSYVKNSIAKSINNYLKTLN